MKNEFIRLFKYPIVMIAAIFIVFVLLFFSINHKMNSTTQSIYFDHSIYYENVEDITEKITDLENDILELDTNDRYYEQIKKNLEENLSIYKLLYANSIEQENVAEIGGINDDSLNRITVLKGLSDFILSSVIVLIIIVIVLLFTRDFDTGVYKFLYGQNVPRIKIVRKKFCTLLLVILCFYILTLFVSLFILLPIQNDFDYVLIFISDLEPVLIDINIYLIYIILSVTFTIFSYMVLFFAISLLIRRTLSFLVVSAATLILIQVLLPLSKNDILLSFSYPFVFTLDIGVNLSLVMLTSIIKAILFIVLLAYGMIKFNKKNITT